MSNIKIVTDGFGRPKPVKEEELYEYGLDINGEPSGSGVGGISRVSMVIPFTDIATLDTNPITIIPAPGADKIIYIHSILAMSSYMGDVFSSVTFTIGTPQPNGIDYLDISTLLIDPISQLKAYNGIEGVAALAYLNNKPIIIHTGGADPGEGTTNLTVTIFYTIEDIIF